MSGQVFESIGYLLWAAGFVILIVGLGTATIGYRRFTHRQDQR